MADAAREAGAEIRTGAPVERILVDGGRAAGVALADGNELRAARVLSNADPKTTFLRLVDEALLPQRFAAAIRAYRCEGTSVKINLAVDRLPIAAAVDGDRVQPYHRGIMEVNPTVAEMDWAQAQARAGRPADDPHIELCIPTVHDPSLAPPGKHVVTIDVNSQPYSLAEGDWDGDPRPGRRPRDRQARGLLSRPDRLDHRSSGARADRPRVAARHLGRSRAARRHVVRPALQPAPGARLGRLPHAGSRPLAVRRRHPPRRRRHRRERAQLRPRGAPRAPRVVGAAARSAAMSPLIPPEWESIEAPTMRVTPPGPRSREVLDRIERTAYPGLSAGLTPLALDSKRAWTVTDLDGNVYLDCASASASVPLGAGRPELLAPVVGGARAVRQRGQPRARLGAHRRARRAPAGDHAGEPDPLRHRAQRHRGGRDRDQADAPRDGPARDPRASTAPTTASRP